MNIKLSWIILVFLFLGLEDKKTIEIDPQEFAPGHPNVQVSPNEQLFKFPLPRYKPGHRLLRNYNWMGLSFIGGLESDGIAKETAIKNATDLQEELALHWNYYIHIGNSRLAFNYLKYHPDKYTLHGESIKLANRYPDIPIAITTFWPQLDLSKIGDKERASYVLRQDLPETYYLGEKVENKKRLISPAAPGDLFSKDGQAQRLYLETLIPALTRPINIINENGEVRPHPMNSSAINSNEALKAHYKASGFKDWKVYESEQKLRFRKLYRDAFMDKIPALKNTTFTWYAIDGMEKYRFQYDISRKISTPINGQYYSTPDFYPRWPDNWRKWKGAWHGWDWIAQCRKTEIRNGDLLFSPFVAAGWDIDPERNVRPSQWLALLKHLAVVGAEFYYTGFFNESHSKNQKRSNPKNYVWQAVYPSYAQAITSRYEAILRNGELLKNRKGEPILSQYVRDSDVLVTIRKDKEKSQYIIAASIQPDSNQKGDAADEKVIELEFERINLKLKVRRQGSVYFLDLSKRQAPVLVLLDEWHETGHPWYWTEDFIFNAEVFDENNGMQIGTEKANSGLDFSSFTSYISPSEKEAKVSYHFEPRQLIDYNLEIRARVVDNSSKESIELWLDDQALGEINVSKNKWEWICVKGKASKNALKQLSAAPHKLSLGASSTNLQIDQIKLQIR